MGLHQSDRFKQLKIMQDADLIVSECRSLIEQHALDPNKAREVVVKAMLGDQPLPLRGAAAAAAGQPGRV
jgi:heterodisulfide reductase subunit D